MSLRVAACSTMTITHHLSICYNVLRVFAERYEIVDYYLQLNEVCGVLAHERVLRDKTLYNPDWSGLRQSLSQTSPDGTATIIPLPPTDLYSSALKILERCFVRGVTHPSELLPTLTP
jgi:hypothetical protein